VGGVDLGLRSRDSLQPRLSQDGPSALNACRSTKLKLARPEGRAPAFAWRDSPHGRDFCPL